MPRDPRAWLITVARNRIRDLLGAAERQRTRTLIDGDDVVPDRSTAGDDTLRLMLACAHPALDRAVHAPLILQVVMGVATADIATAFAMPTATMAKRLVRAKQRLREGGIRPALPERVDLARVDSVLDAIYAAYSCDWLRIVPEGAVDCVADKAVHASQLLLAALPTHRETRGLAALLLFLHARRSTRTKNGVLVPLDDQDPQEWDRHLIDRAEALLRVAVAGAWGSGPGFYELQAVIQSAHSVRRTGVEVDRIAVARLHDALVTVTPSKGAAVARAVAIGRAVGAETGLRELDLLAERDARIEAFQPYLAARAAVLLELGRTAAARPVLERAIQLATDPPARRHLEDQLGALRAD